MTYIWDRQREGFGALRSLPMGHLGLAEAADSFGGDLALQKWATDLATTWAGRLTTKPDERQREMKKKLDWLAKDYEVVLAGAQKRQGLKKYGSQAILRAWRISREQQMDFATLERSPYLPKTFAPPAGVVPGVVTPLVKYSDKYPVAPLVAAFMQKLLQFSPQARADTYANHGGGAFRGRGFSIDLWLDRSPKDARGFWRPDDAVALLRAVHQAARAVGAEWRVLYNDYSVARIINQETGARRVGFVGGAFPNGGLNWHGPHPLILHFHLDLAPLPGIAAGASLPPSPLPSQPGGSKPGVVSSIASLPKILADAVKSGALTLAAVSRILAGERDAGTLTNLIFYARHPNLPPGYKIRPHEKGLAREWLDIRDKLVNPLLQRLKASPINEPQRAPSARPPAKPTASAPPAPAPGPSGRPTPPTAPNAYRRFRLTTYQVVDQRDAPTGAARVPIYDDQGRKLAEGSPAFFAQLSLEGSGRLEDGRLINVTGKKVRVSHDDYAEVLAYHHRNLPGKPPAYSGIVVENGRVAQALAFHEVPAEKRGVGYGVQRGIPLVPFRTLAADIGRTAKSDPSWKGKGGLVPPGTRVYIREYDGLRLPDGTQHDGWFVVNDTGGGIFGAHFDVFVGARALGKQMKLPAFGSVWFPGIEQRIPSGYDYGLKG
jgi:hypothetical protein